MLHLDGESLNEIFVGAIDALLEGGLTTAPRGLPTHEIFPASFELENPRCRILMVEGRTINPIFAVAETLWILGGSDEPWIFRYNGNLKRYSDDGRLRGAYGPRIRAWAGHVDQLAVARRRLLADPNTRQAVIQVYDPASVQDAHRDIPCTMSYRFLLREGKLHMFTTMRSQDIWLGFPYDVFCNTVIQELMAASIGAELGSYHHCIDSLHLYHRNLEAARGVPTRSAPPGIAMPSLPFDLAHLDDRLQLVLDGSIEPEDPLAPWSALLLSYRSWKAGQQDEAERQLQRVDGPLGEAARRWYRHLRASGTSKPAEIL